VESSRAGIHLNALNNSCDRIIFERIQWRWALNGFTAGGYDSQPAAPVLQW
jgi:hypothetical protein